MKKFLWLPLLAALLLTGCTVGGGSGGGSAVPAAIWVPASAAVTAEDGKFKLLRTVKSFQKTSQIEKLNNFLKKS